MEPNPPLEYMLDDASGVPPGREELEAIVRRGRRLRDRVAIGAVAVALVAGGAGGWWAGGTGSSATRAHQVASAGVAPTPGPIASGSATRGATSPGPVAGVPVAGDRVISPGVGVVQALNRAFVRTTSDGVTIRAFLEAPVEYPPSLKSCLPKFPVVMNELSTAAAIGQTTAFAPDDPAAVLAVSGTGLVGGPEGAPVWVVTAHAGSGVAQVRMVFADGKSDQMAPVGGWATLAHPAPPATAVNASRAPGLTGTLQALDAAGKVVATAAVNASSGAAALVPPPAANPSDVAGSCPVPLPANGDGGNAGTVAPPGTSGSSGTGVGVPSPAGVPATATSPAAAKS